MINKREIVVSSGDPGGCGPYITLKAIENFQQRGFEFFVVGDQKIFNRISVYKKIKNKINFIDLDTPGIERVEKGKSSSLSGEASLSYLDRALELITEKRIKCLVTAPLSKEAVQFSLKNFSGHTEYLASHFNVKNFAMMMASSSLKVVMATRHINLRDVPLALSK